MQKTAEGIAYAREIDHVFSLVYALTFSQILTMLLSDIETTHRSSKEAIKLGVEYKVSSGSAIPDLVEIWVTATPDTKETSIQRFKEKIDNYSQHQPNKITDPLYGAMLADLLERAGAGKPD